METNGIYFTAVVHDKTDPAHTPFVAVPLGPYHPDELDRIEQAKIWLRTTYATEDIRRVEPPNAQWDFADVRGAVIRQVTGETERSRLAAEAARAEAALRSVRAEVWEHEDGPDLDAVLSMLGVNPGDV
ncbi:hypothetical protein SEA_HENOCCUS_69 [Streptomyces phage Henoccus]|nr:hypothetical protein SEA_HENOCCUS_69 [Streptomyces phage Henoccus]AWY07387.1 hypothetical protein SEA_JACKIEB_69 [Streptomyces phage JackieB]